MFPVRYLEGPKKLNKVAGGTGIGEIGPQALMYTRLLVYMAVIYAPASFEYSRCYN